MQVVFFRKPTERNYAERSLGKLNGLRLIEVMADNNGYFNPTAALQLERKFQRLKDELHTAGPNVYERSVLIANIYRVRYREGRAPEKRAGFLMYVPQEYFRFVLEGLKASSRER
jgi:hypothetical protein